MITPTKFTRSILIEDMVSLNLRSFFNIDKFEIKLLLATIILFQDRKFKSNVFSIRDLKPIVVSHLDMFFGNRRAPNLLLTSLTEKGFFIRVGIVHEVVDGKKTRVTKYSLNKDKFNYFIAIFQAFINLENSKFKGMLEIKVKRIPLKQARIDVAKHMKKMKSYLKKK